MTQVGRTLIREFGAAFGVLAMLALVVLAPIHHVHALADAADGDVHAPICTFDGAAHGMDADERAARASCPFCRAGDPFVLAPPARSEIALPTDAHAVDRVIGKAQLARVECERASRPRGPPLSV